jgi:hypothetical protein
VDLETQSTISRAACFVERNDLLAEHNTYQSQIQGSD